MHPARAAGDHHRRRGIAARVIELEGQVTLVRSAALDAARAEAIIVEFKAARSAEYAEIAHEAQRLLEHVARETEHRDFSFAELEELEEDLTKLKRWMSQVRSRDYFPDGSSGRPQQLLERCDEALTVFLEAAAARDTST